MALSTRWCTNWRIRESRSSCCRACSAGHPFNARSRSRELLRHPVFIEQSLSDFGDADAIVLIDRTEGGKSAVFIEGKVKSSQAATWTLTEQFETFRLGLDSKVSSSNLFTQLYHKVRFVEAARCGDKNALHTGVPFPTCSSKQLRRIGKNPVVLRATEAIAPISLETRITWPLCRTRLGVFMIS